MTMLSLTEDEDWRAVVEHLPSGYEQLAGVHKQLQTQYGNAKITSADWLLRFILLHVGANLPLLQTVTLVSQAGGPRLSAMRLHMKMRRAAPYLQALVERMVPWAGEAQVEKWAGYSMVLVDATCICGPGATGIDARLHTKLRVADMAIVDAEVTDVRGGETLKRFLFAPGELVIADRGYCNAQGLTHALERGADVLVRYNRGTLPPQQTSTGTPFDALATVRRLRDDGVLDLPLSFEFDGERFHGRFIAARLPAADAAAARDRARKEYRGKVTPETLEAAGYFMLFTTVPRDRMTAAKCLLAYRLRWQIELQFKRWKSLCGFDRLPNYRDDTIIAWVYAKLLLGLLLDRMSARQSELSPPVQIAPIPPSPRRKRRTAPTHGSPTVEADQHLVSATRGSLAAGVVARSPRPAALIDGTPTTTRRTG